MSSSTKPVAARESRGDRLTGSRRRWPFAGAIARWLLSALLLVSVGSASGCSWGRRLRARISGNAGVAPTLRLAFVTDLEGYLEPCGCSSRQLGGIDRLATKLAELRRQKPPVVFVAAGDLFFAEASTAEGHDQQDRWKAETVADVLRALDVAAITPGARDRTRGEDELQALRVRTGAPWLAVGITDDAGGGFVGRSIREVAGVKVGLLGVSDVVDGAAGETERLAAARREAAALRSSGAAVVIALVRGDRRLQSRVAALEGVSFVVGGGIDQEVPNAPAEHGGFVVHGGRQGQRLVVVDIHVRGDGPFADASAWSVDEARASSRREADGLTARLAAWRRDGIAESDLAPPRERLRRLEEEIANLHPAARGPGNWFAARVVELEGTMPRDASISEVLATYDRRVNEHNRIALANVLPPAPVPGLPSYVGSPACASCHESAMRWWRGHPLGNAYATLVRRHKEFNLDCVGCHVTGYDQPGGSNATHLLDGALANVGCESCHGPGSEHVANPEAAEHDVHREVPAATCVTCHNEEHSDQFDYELYRRRILVPGHGLPEAAR